MGVDVTGKMPGGFKRALKKAEKMAGQDDKVPILKLQERASALAKKNKVDLERVWQVLETFIRLVRSWAGGEYKYQNHFTFCTWEGLYQNVIRRQPEIRLLSAYLKGKTAHLKRAFDLASEVTVDE